MDLATVVLADDVAVDPRKYGDLLAPILGVTRLEAKIAVRRGRGLFVEDVDVRDAERIVAELARDGIAARAVRNDALPPLGAPVRVSSFERMNGGLRWMGPAQPEWAELTWHRMDVVSFGALPGADLRDLYANVPFDHAPALHRLDDDTEARDALRETLIARMRDEPAPKKARPGDASVFEELQGRAGKPRVCLDVIDLAGPHWLRASMESVAFAPGAGQVRFGEAWAFEALARELRAHRPDALTAVSLKFVPGADIKDVLFLQPEEFTRYTAWHAVRRHLGMKPCANAGSSSP